MRSRTYATLALLLAPAAGLLTGVWAEWGDLNPTLLLSIAVPAIAASTLAAAYLARSLARPIVMLLLAAAIGAVTFVLSDGTYLAFHFSRGGRLNFEAYDSQRAMAAAFLGIHAAVGTMVGLAIGATLALLAALARLRGWPPLETPA